MKAKTYLLLLIMIFGMDTFSQTSISGTIWDKSTGKPLAGANIVINELQSGTTTNASGYYRIPNLNTGKYIIEASFLGYKTESATLDLKTGDNVTHDFRLMPAGIEMSSVVITATRTKRKIEEVPARMAVIGASQVDDFPATDVDDVLKSISNVYVNRSWGIFSKNTSVTMRGLDGTSRTLVLLDGVPLNKVSGGQIQWALIRPEDVEKIEVIKGPGSALYGMNAMGGVINVITKKPQAKLNLNAELHMGSMNTYGGYISASGNEIRNDKGLTWGIKGFYRQGDGYIIEPTESRDSTDAKAYLNEGNINTSLGYRFNKNHSLELSYEYHDEKRGDGRKVFEEDGGYNRYELNHLRASYSGILNGATIEANAFFQTENYDRQSETVNSTGTYRLYLTDSWKTDQGLWTTVSKEWFRGHLITAGLDIRNGNVDAKDIYLTSTDEIRYKGKLSFAGIFLQDEMNFSGGKLKIIAGVRLDLANFRDGNLIVIDPTAVTGYPEPSNETFDENTWTSFSPKISGMYFFTKTLSSYLSYSTGFNPPKLDDLCKSGKISKGFKLANPDLKPETITTYEWGLNFQPGKKMKIEPSIYFSSGDDFQYFVPTGDSIDTGGGMSKPYLNRENISVVEIFGLELNIIYYPIKSISVIANYAFNHSTITRFRIGGEDPSENLEGLSLAEVPEHTFFAAINWQNRFVNIQLNSNHVSEMWGDEYNTYKIDPYWMFDAKIWKDIYDHWRVSLTVQDIFDRQPIDKKLRLSPGRFYMGKVGYRL
nr:TonB-dependent receptor [Bacteroidota bacterium]